MQHGELKTLLWGKHLSRMLGVCGVRHLPSDPAPRIVPPVPQWYQRLAGILTIAGLVATVHMIDTALRYQSDPSPWWDGTQAAAFDTTAWTRWTSSNTQDRPGRPDREPGPAGLVRRRRGLPVDDADRPGADRWCVAARRPSSARGSDSSRSR